MQQPNPPDKVTEFSFIESISKLFSDLQTPNIEGIGDDCAVISIGNDQSLVVTSDMLVEGIHFLRNATSARELGAKSLAVNLSDVAAMGARPIATLLAISLPSDATQGWAEEFMEGYHELSKLHNTALIGGDTTSSKGGITISITAIGQVADANIKRRSAASVGDIIFVGGALGESGRGLADILNGNLNTTPAATHRNPTPQVELGIWLGEHPAVHAMMDLSDGLASDLRHILKRSGVGASINLEQIPVAEGANIEEAICAGEDYKLLFTANPNDAETLIKQHFTQFSEAIYPIGIITADDDIVWLRNGNPESHSWSGFTHY